MQRKNIRKQIKRLDTVSANNEQNINKLKKFQKKLLSFNYSKKIHLYETDWITSSSAEIELRNFTEDFIANMKVVGLFKTTSEYMANNTYIDFIPEFEYSVAEQPNKYIVTVKSMTSTIPSTSIHLWMKVKIYISNIKDYYEVQAKKT